MTRIDLPGKCIDEIVVHKHFVPRADEIRRDVVSDLQVSVHSKETLERSVNRVVERDAVETVVWCVPQEVLVIIGSQVGGSKETGRELGGSSTAATAGILG